MPETVALAAPPRSLPMSTWLRVVFGGWLMLAGWIAVGVTGVFAAVFLRMAEPLFGDPGVDQLRVAEGRVLAVESTGFRVNSETVRAVRFDYLLGDRRMEGVSYTTGGVPEVGAVVPVEHAPGHAARARIRGMRRAPFPAAVGLLLLVPGAASIVLVIGVVLGVRRAALLRHGVLARARLVASEPTNTRINNQRVYRLTFRWQEAGGREREGTCRTHKLAPLTDERDELVLYDPNGPRMVPWDALPFAPPRDRDGHFQPLGFGGVVPVLIAPSLLVVVWSLGSSLLDLLPT